MYIPTLCFDMLKVDLNYELSLVGNICRRGDNEAGIARDCLKKGEVVFLTHLQLAGATYGFDC